MTVSGDLFRRHDVSGFWQGALGDRAHRAALYRDIFLYLHRGMAERDQARSKQARDELRQVLGFSAADEIEKLNRLKSTGSISEQEYARLRSQIVQ
jgi:hypothetical protein